MFSSVRFTANLAILLAGAWQIVVLFAYSFSTAHWVALGVAAIAAAMGLYSFAMPRQGVYQRLADVAMCALAAWAVVAAFAVSDRSIWLLFGAGGGLALLGVLGLLARERELNRGLLVGQTRIGPDELTQMSLIQREAEAQQ